MLTLEDKKAIVSEVAEVAANSTAVVAADYRGLSVTEMTELRRAARETGVYLRVVKNTLAKRAIAGTEFECVADQLQGPLVLAFSGEEPSSAARVIKDFAKEHDKLETRVIGFGGQTLSAADLDTLAKMPTRDQAISMLMAAMKAPVTKLVRTLAEPNNKLARTFAALRDQKDAA
ncbi:MAG: 50S ribosomal protein L10 [Gammaproteobacteria bacterium]|nr:MAG: 50S ribosomal protein L10 [Gammaproteobacteria bacterium]